MEKNKGAIIAIIVFIAFIFIVGIAMENKMDDVVNSIKKASNNSSSEFRIISSTENKDLEPVIQAYARKNDIDLDIEYAGTIDIMDRLNNNEEYDAV